MSLDLHDPDFGKKFARLNRVRWTGGRSSADRKSLMEVIELNQRHLDLLDGVYPILLLPQVSSTSSLSLLERQKVDTKPLVHPFNGDPHDLLPLIEDGTENFPAGNSLIPGTINGFFVLARHRAYANRHIFAFFESMTKPAVLRITRVHGDRVLVKPLIGAMYNYYCELADHGRNDSSIICLSAQDFSPKPA